MRMLQAREEVLDFDACLFQSAANSANGQGRVERDYATGFAPPQDHVTAALPRPLKTETFQGADGSLSRDLPQSRHIGPRTWSGRHARLLSAGTPPDTVRW